MEIAHTIKNDKLIITPEFERLDVRNTLPFKANLIDLIEKEQKYQVVIDLHRLNFMDSSGVGVFLALLRFIHTKGGELKISSITQPVRTILELVSLNKILEIYNTSDDAINSFKPIIKTSTNQ